MAGRKVYNDKWIAGVWYVADTGVPGLATEAETLAPLAHLVSRPPWAASQPRQAPADRLALVRVEEAAPLLPAASAIE